MNANLVTQIEEARDALITHSDDPAFSEEARAIYDQLANDLDRIIQTRTETLFDVTIEEKDKTAWVLVDDLFVVNIVRTDEGIVVDVYPEHDIVNEPLASTFVFDAEVQPDDGFIPTNPPPPPF